jgi:hypothetical protein
MLPSELFIVCAANNKKLKSLDLLSLVNLNLVALCLTALLAGSS